jgi:hypothetical protein
VRIGREPLTNFCGFEKERSIFAPEKTRKSCRTNLDDIRTHAVSVSDLVHVALQIEVEELEDEVELRLGVGDVEKAVFIEEKVRNLSVSARRLAPLLHREPVTTVRSRRTGEAKTHRTTFSCFISFNKLISRMAVLGTPSSSDSRRIFLSATISPVSRLRERY